MLQIDPIPESHLKMVEQHLLEFKGVVHRMHRAGEEMQQLIQKNIKLLVKKTALLKMCLGATDVELQEKTLVGTVGLCQEIKSQIELEKRDLESMEKMAKSIKESFPHSYITLLESSVIVLKSTMKEFEEVFPEIGDILERMDKPASLLELGLERVQGLGFIQLGASFEQLPVTLKAQVEHWPTTRKVSIREKIDFLVQALGKIADISSMG